ncbi:hypothetical protein QO207_17540, partial [Pseudomonas sp. CAN2814]|nr:hypothetical protein [Pseudomonas sp. CAN1]
MVLGRVREQARSYTRFQLPAIELRWWAADSGEQRSAVIPALKLSAQAAAAYQAPFSISDDLRELGRK